MTTWLTPPVVCERLEEILPRFHGAMTVRSAAGRVRYEPPVNATEEVRAYLQARSQIEPGPGFLARLPGGRVFGSGAVLSPDGRSIARDVSEDFGKPFADHWLLTYPRIRAAEIIQGSTAVIATTQGVGYSHWLLEELPRLLTTDLTGCDAIIANVRERFAREALRHHGFPGKVLPARRDHHLQCEQLLIPSLPGPVGWPTPEVVRLVTGFSETLRGTKSSVKSDRLYISRARARRRRVVNEDALWLRLEAKGFRKVFLEDMPWMEQIAVFRGAREIVAPHGAGLGNLIFCEAGTRVVEFFDRTYVNPCFWRLAALKGLDYRLVVSEGDEPIAQNLSANRNDITVDVTEVLRALG